MWNVHFKDGCKDHVIPESHFEGSRAVVLGGGGQGVFQKAQRQVVLHHSVQHQANVVLWRSEGGGGGRAVSSGGWTAASALAEQSHLQGATLELVCWLVQTFWVICDWVSQQTLIWMKGIKPMICLKKMEATSSFKLSWWRQQPTAQGIVGKHKPRVGQKKTLVIRCRKVHENKEGSLMNLSDQNTSRLLISTDENSGIVELEWRCSSTWQAHTRWPSKRQEVQEGSVLFQRNWQKCCS